MPWHGALEPRRLLATLLVGGLLVWLWQADRQVDGPALRLSSSQESRPQYRLIGEPSPSAPMGFGLAADAPLGGHGFGFVTEDDERQPFGLVAASDDGARSRPQDADLVARAASGDPEGLGARRQPSESIGVAERRDADGRYRGLYLESTGLDLPVRGFAGPIEIGLYLDESGAIRRLVHLASQETPSYLRRLDEAGFYERFEGVSLADSRARIDAVTGATITSEALARTLTALIDRAAESPLGDYLATPPYGFAIEARLSQIWVLHAVLLAVFFVIVWQRRWRLDRRGRLLLAVASVGYIGFLLGNAFSYITLLHPFLGVGISSLALIYAALVLAGAVWDDNTYCREVCPFGHAQRLVARFDRASRLRRWPLGNRTMTRLRWLLAAVLVTGILLGQEGWTSFELFPDLFGLDTTSIWFLVAVFLVLRAAAWVPMIWCRLLCPTGAVLDSLAWLARPAPPRKAGRPKTKSGVSLFVPFRPPSQPGAQTPTASDVGIDCNGGLDPCPMHCRGPCRRFSSVPCISGSCCSSP
jgi:NosR/NirI family nitrous oxide reductase transcriptional regulator